MLGAIVGDIVGSPYEFDHNAIKTTEFPLFSSKSRYTDDTVMTLAVARGLLDADGDQRRADAALITAMRDFGARYPDAGYGGRFSTWLKVARPIPYDSYGNGSAMRVSPVAWLFETMDDVESWAEITARVSHNHPEGIKGARATAASILMARLGASKDEIRGYVAGRFGYNLDRTIEEIRPNYRHVESCQETVPEAIVAFLQSTDFESAIRLAVSLGGDADTLAAIAGSIAEAAYGIPDHIAAEADARLNRDLRAALAEFEQVRAR